MHPEDDGTTIRDTKLWQGALWVVLGLFSWAIVWGGVALICWHLCK